MSPPRPVTSVRAIKVRPDRHVELPEHVATEEPMQIQIAGPGQDPAPLAVTMRTPGHDFDLAIGFLISEGVVTRGDVASAGYCDVPGMDDSERFNTVTVRVRHPWTPPSRLRQFVVSASCGVCGKGTVEDLMVACSALGQSAPLPASLVMGFPDALRRAQPAFDRTGGLHAAGLFDPTGQLLCAREDVGRHNAVDKVVGHTVIGSVYDRDILVSSVLMVSGRVSFEIIQKAAVAGFGTIAAVSAPSSLAVAAAERLGVSLIAFLRGSSFNLYAHPERIDLDG